MRDGATNAWLIAAENLVGYTNFIQLMLQRFIYKLISSGKGPNRLSLEELWAVRTQ